MKKNYLCERKCSLVTIHTHNTLPVHFPTLLPMGVHDIQRCRTLNIAILTPNGMMLLKLKNREKINFNISIETFLEHLENNRLTQSLMSCFLAKNQVPFEICVKMAFQINFLKQSFKFNIS